MRILFILLQKEFRQIFRNKAILAIIFVMPTIQFLILPLAANYEFTDIKLSIVDHDHSPFSRHLISKIQGSGFFDIVSYDDLYTEAYKLIESDASDLILEIPAGFERKLVRENNQKLFVAINAINGTKANIGGNYLSHIIRDFSQHLSLSNLDTPAKSIKPSLRVVTMNWFNPEYNYNLALIPGILALLVTMVGGFLSALNIVKEKESGTIEQINVTPIKKRDFILAKLIPFWILANVVFSIGLVLSYYIYQIEPVGSLLALYSFVSIYLLAVLGFGLLISTFCETQQQAMFIMFFFMLIFILLGGLFSPIDSMPPWVQLISQLNPVRYLIEVMRLVMLKGSSILDVAPQLCKIVAMAIILNLWAMLNYRKVN